jgi:nucleoside-diphosphate-sugar epimerase
LSKVEVRPGSIGDPESLRQAMAGITHVIHCAGATKAARVSGFYEVNQAGTRNVVSAINEQAGQVQRVVHVSSLAAAGPAVAEKPARERDAPRPVSEYGKSKLAGELEVRNHCRAQYVILRPAAVYGPRDTEFLRLFRAVKNHLLPKPSGAQALSLVFVRDLAEAVVTCLTHPAAAGKTYFVSAREIVTARVMAQEIAARMNVWTLPLPLPTALLWPVCLAQELMSRLTGKPNVLSLQKFAELRAPGWVCDPTRLERETGCACPTTLKAGVAETLAWYRQQCWL